MCLQQNVGLVRRWDDPQIIQRQYTEGKDFRAEVEAALKQSKSVQPPRVAALTNWTYTTKLYSAFSTVEEAVEAAEERAQTPVATGTQQQEEQRLEVDAKSPRIRTRPGSTRGTFTKRDIPRDMNARGKTRETLMS